MDKSMLPSDYIRSYMQVIESFDRDDEDEPDVTHQSSKKGYQDILRTVKRWAGENNMGQPNIRLVNISGGALPFVSFTYKNPPLFQWVKFTSMVLNAYTKDRVEIMAHTMSDISDDDLSTCGEIASWLSSATNQPFEARQIRSAQISAGGNLEISCHQGLAPSSYLEITRYLLDPSVWTTLCVVKGPHDSHLVFPT